MHFSRSLTLVFGILLVFGCTESGSNPPELTNLQMSIEALSESVNEINFTGTLPDGQSIEFSPSKYVDYFPSHQYTVVGGLNFTNESGEFNFDVGQLSNAGAQIDIRTINGVTSDQFQYGFIATVGEMAMLFPDFFSNVSEIEDWIYAVALGSSRYDINDFIGQFIVTDYLVVIGIPERGTSFGTYLDIDSDTSYDLSGFYTLTNSLVSEGTVSIFIPTVVEFEDIGTYELYIKE